MMCWEYADITEPNIPQMKIKAVSQRTARFNIQRKPEKCWCLLRNLSFGLSDHKKIPGHFQDFSKILAKFQDFPKLFSIPRTVVREEVPTPPFFKAPTPSTSLPPPLLKMFFSLPSFLFHPISQYFRQFPLFLTQLSTALNRPTNLSWFKQISKRQFYLFNCRFLSKINF